MKRRKQEDKVKRVQQQEECFKHVKVANLLVLAATKTEACDPIASTDLSSYDVDLCTFEFYYVKREGIVAAAAPRHSSPTQLLALAPRPPRRAVSAPPPRPRRRRRDLLVVVGFRSAAPRRLATSPPLLLASISVSAFVGVGFGVGVGVGGGGGGGVCVCVCVCVCGGGGVSGGGGAGCGGGVGVDGGGGGAGVADLWRRLCVLDVQWIYWHYSKRVWFSGSNRKKPFDKEHSWGEIFYGNELVVKSSINEASFRVKVIRSAPRASQKEGAPI
ncbi:hypothetical protein Ahy_A01g001205 isoform A [Arachis hypogaea]|uniref:Uncharacterized protein n=1 Tax=Arachis hypogaea TaxID=3818 RepID=A0A445EMR4_ARAHY|nr:hypothetical protein Ahy_A01g001205 isoform A [Arachis hypogaea]